MIDLNKRYRTRDGRDVKVLCVDAPGSRPVVGYYVTDGFDSSVTPRSWKADGRTNQAGDVDNVHDLIEVRSAEDVAGLVERTPENLVERLRHHANTPALDGRSRPELLEAADRIEADDHALAAMLSERDEAQTYAEAVKADFDELEKETDRLQKQVQWLEENSRLKTPDSVTIRDYLAVKEDGEWETPCLASEDGMHCNCWYDGEACCNCKDPADPNVERAEAAERERDKLMAERDEAWEALRGLVKVIDAAGLLNLSNGVQLGSMSWYVKAGERMRRARAALSPTDNQEK